MNKMFIMGIVLSLSLFVPVLAENWITSVDLSLSMNQNSYSDNWHGEEKSNINWAFNANLLAEKQLSVKVTNTNTLKLAIGQTHSQYIDGNDDNAWAKPDKTTDLIDLESMFRFTLGAFVDPFASFRLESQFLDQSFPEDTKFFNPVKLTESFGFARVWLKKDKKELTSRLGAAFKEYLNRHESVDNSNDGGVEFVTDFRTQLAKDRISYNSKLELFKAFYFSEAELAKNTEFEDAWKAPRINWENIFSANITKIISINLYIQLLYNEMILYSADIPEVIDELQYKQTLALSFTYKLL